MNHGGRMPNILVKSILSSICAIYRKHYILYRPTRKPDEPKLLLGKKQMEINYAKIIRKIGA